MAWAKLVVEQSGNRIAQRQVSCIRHGQIAIVQTSVTEVTGFVDLHIGEYVGHQGASSNGALVYQSIGIQLSYREVHWIDDGEGISGNPIVDKQVVAIAVVNDSGIIRWIRIVERSGHGSRIVSSQAVSRLDNA